ncbi:hypothetical protein LR48_Vigan11g048200 [Vigna angularis]|uniref:Uncharacterized protein n=1 Tax=Phaseolus angularis TaxID=3914 RepID=A0A0L9VRU3_PHAAN|nr:hypothetical protein LR48_Vigan11g048200 [Vigna angularis]
MGQRRQRSTPLLRAPRRACKRMALSAPRRAPKSDTETIAHCPGTPFGTLERRKLEALASSGRLKRGRPLLTAWAPLLGRLSTGSSKLGRHLEGLSVKGYRSPPRRPKWGD